MIGKYISKANHLLLIIGMSERDKKELSKDKKDQTTDPVQKQYKVHFKIMLVMFSPRFLFSFHQV